jgi:pSer/pThr/pTyr-binding forkhead associated (FHA) protein
MRQGDNFVESGELTLHLLDAADGRPIQTWQFERRTTVSIGRAAESDISLSDPQVSRCHVELRFSEAHWTLVSKGRNGTLVNGEHVSELRLNDQVIFQLGPNGPTFKFVNAHSSAGEMATIGSSDSGLLDFLVIDQQKKRREVEQIAGGDAFKQLQQQARELRQQRDLDETRE